MKLKFLLLGLALATTFSCTNGKYAGVPEKYHDLLDQTMTVAGENASELQKALQRCPSDQKEGMAFLIAYMPERDAVSLDADFLLENVQYAYQARKEFSWAAEVPEEVFLNDVLPYVNLNEKRENWRKDFYERFKKYVVNCQTMSEAIDSVNANIREEVDVVYNTKRRKPDQAPYESMEIHMASCSGLSILLADALRAVGIPSRVAGTPSWHDNRGNHNWNEVWIDGEWHFLEYASSAPLDGAWFLADAGKADKDNFEKAIYAASYKPTSLYFPLVWDLDIRYVHAENVTDSYVRTYQSNMAAIQADGKHVALRVMVFKDRQHAVHSEDRVPTNLDIFQGRRQLGGGRSAGPTQDMNDVLTFMLEKNQSYTVNYVDGKGVAQKLTVKLGSEPKTLKLYME